MYTYKIIIYYILYSIHIHRYLNGQINQKSHTERSLVLSSHPKWKIQENIRKTRQLFHNTAESKSRWTEDTEKFGLERLKLSHHGTEISFK